MSRKLVVLALLSLLSVDATAQSARRDQTPLTLMGRKVIVSAPKLDANDFPIGSKSASVCVDGPPQRQCYTAPQGFQMHPQVAKVQLSKDVLALLFSAETYGVSGWQIHFALLRIAPSEKDLEDLILSDASVSAQSQHRFWNVPEVSDAKIFLTADYVWGQDEAHVGAAHRFIISSYVMKRTELDNPSYYLEDRYMTVRKYEVENPKVDILASEKQEILARLARIKAAAKN